MTLRSSQRGTMYLEAGRTLLRTAQAVIDSVIAARLKSLADDYQSQERSRLDQPNGIGSIGCQQLR